MLEKIIIDNDRYKELLEKEIELNELKANFEYKISSKVDKRVKEILCKYKSYKTNIIHLEKSLNDCIEENRKLNNALFYAISDLKLVFNGYKEQPFFGRNEIDYFEENRIHLKIKNLSSKIKYVPSKEEKDNPYYKLSLDYIINNEY